MSWAGLKTPLKAKRPTNLKEPKVHAGFDMETLEWEVLALQNVPTDYPKGIYGELSAKGRAEIKAGQVKTPLGWSCNFHEDRLVRPGGPLHFSTFSRCRRSWRLSLGGWGNEVFLSAGSNLAFPSVLFFVSKALYYPYLMRNDDVDHTSTTLQHNLDLNSTTISSDTR